MHIRSLIGCLILALFCSSCGLVPDVVVVDSSGKPIAGAKVEPVSGSFNYREQLTDAKGQARIRGGILQEVQWINVSKAGYSPQKSIDFFGPKPIRVELTP